MKNKELQISDFFRNEDTGVVIRPPSAGIIINYNDDDELGNNLTEDSEVGLSKKAVGLTSLPVSSIPSDSTKLEGVLVHEELDEGGISNQLYGGESNIESTDSNPPINISENRDGTINNNGDHTDKAASLSWPNKFFNKVTLGEKMNKEQRSIEKLYRNLDSMGFKSEAQRVKNILVKEAAMPDLEKDPAQAMANLKTIWTDLEASVSGALVVKNSHIIYKQPSGSTPTLVDINKNDGMAWAQAVVLIRPLINSTPSNANEMQETLEKIKLYLARITDKEMATSNVTTSDTVPMVLTPWSQTAASNTRRNLSNLLSGAPLLWSYVFNDTANGDNAMSQMTDFLNHLSVYMKYYKVSGRQYIRYTNGQWRENSKGMYYIKYAFKPGSDREVFTAEIWAWLKADNPGAVMPYPTNAIKTADAQETTGMSGGGWGTIKKWLTDNGYKKLSEHPMLKKDIKKASVFFSDLDLLKFADPSLDGIEWGNVSTMNLANLKAKARTEGIAFSETSAGTGTDKVTTISFAATVDRPYTSATYDSTGAFKEITDASTALSTTSDTTNDDDNNDPPTPTTGGDGTKKEDFKADAVTLKAKKISEHLPTDAEEVAFRTWIVRESGLTKKQIKDALRKKNPVLRQSLGTAAYRNGYTSTAWEIWGDSWLVTVKPDEYKDEEESEEASKISDEAVKGFIFGGENIALWMDGKPDDATDRTRKEILESYARLKVLTEATTDENKANKIRLLGLIEAVPSLMNAFRKALVNAAKKAGKTIDSAVEAVTLIHAGDIAGQKPAESGQQAAGSTGGSGGSKKLNLQDAVFFNIGGSPFATREVDGKQVTSLSPGSILVERANGNAYFAGDDGTVRPLRFRSGSPFLTNEEATQLETSAGSQGAPGDWSQFLSDAKKVWQQRVNPEVGFLWDSVRENIMDLANGSSIGKAYVNSPEFRALYSPAELKKMKLTGFTQVPDSRSDMNVAVNRAAT